MKTISVIFKAIGVIVLILIAFILFNHFSRISEQLIKTEDIETEKRYNQSDSVVCILSTNKRKYKIGQPLELNVEIINHLDTPILMVGSLDGSEIGFRPPISYFEVRHKILGKVWSASLFCGTVNPLRKEDFKIIGPNQIFNPYEVIDDYGFFHAQQLEEINFKIPGIYEIIYRYSKNNNNKVEQIYSPRMEMELINMWNKVPNLNLTSNTITIEYNL